MFFSSFCPALGNSYIFLAVPDNYCFFFFEWKPWYFSCWICLLPWRNSDVFPFCFSSFYLKIFQCHAFRQFFFYYGNFRPNNSPKFYKLHRRMKIFLSLNEQERAHRWEWPISKKGLLPPKKIISIKLYETKLIKKRKTLFIKKIYFITKKERVCFYLACGETFRKFPIQKNLPGLKKHFMSNKAATPRSTTKTHTIWLLFILRLCPKWGGPDPYCSDPHSFKIKMFSVRPIWYFDGILLVETKAWFDFMELPSELMGWRHRSWLFCVRLQLPRVPGQPNVWSSVWF